MKNLHSILTIAFVLFCSAAFCQGKSERIIKDINVYFPGSEVRSDGHKLNLMVEGRVVAVPLCHTEIAKDGDHNFSFTTRDKGEKLMRGDQVTTVVHLQLVHSSADRLVGLLHDLQDAECGK